MVKTCLQCGKPMQSLRITKKYCSDNCKQLAFYKRYGSQLAELTPKEPSAGPEITEIDNSLDDAVDRLNDAAPLSAQKESDEPPYEYVYSAIVEKMNTYIENSQEADLFQYPERAWGAYKLPAVKWVSLRLRCLLESLIRVSDFSHIDYPTLVAVKEAFDQLMASRHFKSLPSSYPYTGLVQELQEKLTAITRQCKRKQSIRFRLSLNRKADLIAKRYILAGFVGAIKFSELDFDE